MLEGLEVSVEGLERNAPGLGSLLEELGVVNTLSTRDDLLTANEHIVAVAVSLRNRGAGEPHTLSLGSGMV